MWPLSTIKELRDENEVLRRRVFEKWTFIIDLLTQLADAKNEIARLKASCVIDASGKKSKKR